MKTALHMRDHFFRMTAYIGIGATMVACMSVLVVSFIFVRNHMIDDFHRATETVASMYTFSISYTNAPPFENYIQHLVQYGEFTRVCAYNADNHLIAQWQVSDDRACPKHMAESGSQTNIFTIYFAEPVEKNGQYIGMIYTEGNLTTLHSWLITGSILLGGLLLVCWIACRMSAFGNAHSVTVQLAEIREQIECLKGNDVAFCAIPSQKMMTEVAELSDAVLSLRSYLDTTKVSKEAVMDLRRWHWKIVTGLLANLRHLLDADSPLLETLSDYALLIHMERGDLLPPAKPFDIAQVLDNALSAARKLHPVAERVNLTASLQSNMPRRWIGQPELLEALLRHILLIGLKRTQSGLVCIRLQAISDERLHIAFEDSGIPLQPWQITQWLTYAPEEMVLAHRSDDISWLLVSHLLKQLKGNITGTSGKEGGLILEASVPLESDITPVATGKPEVIADTDKALLHPLALIVDKESIPEQKITSAFTEAGYKTFTVTTHAHAMEWVNLLPFSVVVLNATLPDIKEHTTRRLMHMKEEGNLPSALWVITAKHSFIETDYWHNQGISRLLQLPLSVSSISGLRATLPALKADVHSSPDVEVRQDFTSGIIELLPKIENMLKAQVTDMLCVIDLLAKGEFPADAAEQAHAIKSAALNIGYSKLAALMGQIEYTLRLRHFPHQNWVIIADFLRRTLADDEALKNQSSGRQYYHNASVDPGAAPVNGDLRP